MIQTSVEKVFREVDSKSLVNIRFVAVLWLSSLFLATTPLAAQQLTYPDGQTAVIQNDGAAHSAQFNYSIRYDLAVGPIVQFIDGPDSVFVGGQLTYLLARNNYDGGQFNVVANGGIGIVDGPTDGIAGFTQLSANYAERRFFTSYTIRANFAEDRDAGLRQVGRLGVAPYIATRGHVQPFLAVQVDRFDGPTEEWRVTPFIRLIKDAGLVELGINNNGGILANVVYFF